MENKPSLTPFQAKFLHAQKRAVPIMAVTTTDQQATLDSILPALYQNMPLIVWDIVRGLTGKGKAGIALAEFVNSNSKPEDFQGSDGFVNLITKLQENHEDLPFSVFTLAALNIHRGIEDAAVVQAILNSRDWLAKGGTISSSVGGKVTKINAACSLVFLSPSFSWPLELVQDIYSLEDAAPDVDKLAQIIKDSTEWAGIEAPSHEKILQGAESLLSLNEFSATQEVALALSESPSWVENLGERRRVRVNSTPGLEMYDGSTNFSDVGGYVEAKSFLKRLFAGPLGIKSIFFFDEIEKQLGSMNDSSGVSLRMLGTILSHMSDNKVSGILFHGVPGSGKTALSQACSGEFNVPFVSNDLSSVQDSLVGKSEARLRQNLAIDKALGRGKSLWIATCNEISRIPAPLLSRFDLATYTFDLPTEDELALIWQIQIRAFGLDASQPLPDSAGWTGREVKGCCKKAFALSIPLVEAANYVIPLSVSSPGVIETCHKEAEGKLLSASYPGPFKRSEREEKGRRAINVGEDSPQVALIAMEGRPPYQFTPGASQEELPKKDKIGF